MPVGIFGWQITFRKETKAASHAQSQESMKIYSYELEKTLLCFIMVDQGKKKKKISVLHKTPRSTQPLLPTFHMLLASPSCAQATKLGAGVGGGKVVMKMDKKCVCPHSRHTSSN